MDPLPALASEFGIPSAVILSLVGILLWIVRLIVTGKLIPLRQYDEKCQEADYYRQAAESALQQVRDLTTDKDLSLHLLQAVRNQAAANRGGEDL